MHNIPIVYYNIEFRLLLVVDKTHTIINYCTYSKSMNTHYVATVYILCNPCSYRLTIDPCAKDLWTYHHLVEFLYVGDYLVVVY